MQLLFLLSGMLILFTFNVKPVTPQLALDTAIDSFVAEQMAKQRIPGLALVVTQGDQVLYIKGYGTAGDNQPVTPQTQFFIASLSKSFTALAVMQLVESGRLDLDTPVQHYLPEFKLADPAIASQITIRHLLNHTSGLSDPGFPEARLPQPTTLAERVSNMRTARPVAPPGQEFHYIDANYGVLARLVEVVSGQPFSEYLQTHIFAPLQMAQTTNVITSDQARQEADNLAQGHLVAFGLPFVYPEMSGVMGGSGGVISTAEDMAHYLILQNNGGRYEGEQLLTPEGMTFMHTPPTSLDSTYAMGWFAKTENGRRVIEHNGIISTFYSEAVLLPDAGYGLVLLYNVHSLALDVVGFPEIKNGLIALLVGQQPAPGKLSTGLLEMLVGGLTLVGLALGIHRLLRLPGWREKAPMTPLWRHLLGIGWSFVPAVVLLASPQLVAMTSDRVFNYAQLFRSMLGIMTWLSLSALLGVLNGLARLLFLVRQVPELPRPVTRLRVEKPMTSNRER